MRPSTVSGRSASAAEYAEEYQECGVGHACAHHGELLQGVFRDATGRLVRGLVTLPVPDRTARAVFYPSQRHWGVVGTPELVKVRRAAIYTLRELSTHPAPTKGGQIKITSDIPRGIGMGSSTSDVTATIRAVADYHGVTLCPADVARIAVLAECASDSVMIEDQVVLFAHRDGVTLETFGDRLPPMVLVGCDTDPDGGGIDTVAFAPAEYDDREIGVFDGLRAAARRAVATGDTGLLGRVCTASALLNQRFLRTKHLPELLELCRRTGGCGVQIAHSGTVAGIVFDPRRPATARGVPACRAALDALGLPATVTLSTSYEQEIA